MTSARNVSASSGKIRWPVIAAGSASAKTDPGLWKLSGLRKQSGL